MGRSWGEGRGEGAGRKGGARMGRGWARGGARAWGDRMWAGQRGEQEGAWALTARGTFRGSGAGLAGRVSPQPWGPPLRTKAVLGGAAGPAQFT